MSKSGKRDRQRREPKTPGRKRPGGPHQATCPVCHKARATQHLGEFGDRAALGQLPWACARCLQTKRALKANPALQMWGLGDPQLAYWDRDKTCVECDEGFVFRATEQRYWYETLQFLAYSVPTRCPRCRRNQRRRKAVVRELQRALEQLDPHSADAVGEVGLKHLEAGHLRKAAEWLRRARNLARTPREKTRWTEAIEGLADSD